MLEIVMSQKNLKTGGEFGIHFIKKFLKFSNELKMYHWKTESYSRHKASDKLFKEIGDLADQFIESYMGKYGRVPDNFSYNITVSYYSDLDGPRLLKEYMTFLIDLKVPDEFLCHIRDEMASKLSQSLYLFTLRN
jgi:hypothetical protein